MGCFACEVQFADVFFGVFLECFNEDYVEDFSLQVLSGFRWRVSTFLHEFAELNWVSAEDEDVGGEFFGGDCCCVVSVDDDVGLGCVDEVGEFSAHFGFVYD